MRSNKSMQFNFDATQINPSGGFTVFPLGDYPFIITKEESKTKEGTNNSMLVVTLTVTDGPYKGDTQQDIFNLGNESEKARKVAQSEFSALLHCVGRLQITDTNQIIGGTGIAQFGPQDDNDKYSEVKKYRFGTDKQQTTEPTPAFGGQTNNSPATQAASTQTAFGGTPANNQPAQTTTGFSNGNGNAAPAGGGFGGGSAPWVR